LYQNIINRSPLVDVMGDMIDSDVLSLEQTARVIFLLWQVDLLHLKEELIGSRTQHQLDQLNTFIHQLNNQNRLQRLGLKGGANAQEIRQAYLQLAREYHPDLLPPGTHPEVSRKMSEAFALIADAYSVLTG
jgi:DnaJ-domain-containing protein 1